MPPTGASRLNPIFTLNKNQLSIKKRKLQGIKVAGTFRDASGIKSQYQKLCWKSSASDIFGTETNLQPCVLIWCFSKQTLKIIRVQQKMLNFTWPKIGKIQCLPKLPKASKWFIVSLWFQPFFHVVNLKLDGVGPVDNRPSTD